MDKTGTSKDRKAFSLIDLWPLIELCTGPRLNEYCTKNKRQRWDICKAFTVWHFVTKYTGLKSMKPGMLSHFFQSREHSYVGSTISPECPCNIGYARPAAYTHRKAAQRSSKDQVAWLHLRPSWAPSCGPRGTIWDFSWAWAISGPPPTGAAPTTLLRRNVGTKMIQWMSVYIETLLIKLSLDCLPKANVVYK